MEGGKEEQLPEFHICFSMEDFPHSQQGIITILEGKLSLLLHFPLV